MKIWLKKVIINVFVTFFIIRFLCLAAFAEESFDYSNTQILGMGGVVLVTQGGYIPANHNPSNLAYLNRMKISVDVLSFGLNKDILDIYDLYKESEMQDILDGKKDWEDASGDLKNKMLAHRIARLRLTSNIDFGFPVEFIGSFGVGIYADVVGNVESDKGIYVPTAGLDYKRDFSVIASFARKQKLPFWEDYLDPFGFGINMKYLQRQKMYDFRTLVEYQDFSFMELLHKGWGLGLDLGISYKMLGDRLGYSLVWKDCGNTTLKWDNQDSSQILSRIDFGIDYKPMYLYYWRNRYVSVKDNLIVAFNIKNIGRYEDFYKRLNLGARLNWWIFSLSGGFNQGYSTFGLGLKLGLANLNYAYYGVEQGIFAGQDVDWNHSFSISVVY